jgi:RNA polymerase sigma-32 factor
MSQPFQLLDAAEERRLFLDYRRKHDKALEDRLVRSQLRLVAKLAREYARDEDDVAELIQEGSLGLLHAVRRFDPAHGTRLSTYAGWWIRAHQLRWLVHNHRLVRLGTTAAQRKLFFNLRGEQGRLEAAGADAGVDALARRLHVDRATVEQTLRRLNANDLSLDAPGRDEQAAAIQRLPDTHPLPDVLVEAAERARIVAEEADRFRHTLRGRDLFLFERRWLTDEPATLQALGDQVGVSRERARQLEDRLLEQLRRRLPDGLADAA